MNESNLNDDALMIARVKLATLGDDLDKQCMTVSDRTIFIQLQADRVVQFTFECKTDIAILTLETILSSCAALHTLCTSIAALKAEMDALQAVAWPSESSE